MKAILPILALLISSTAFAQQRLHVKSGVQRTNLLELYSSEGCSSCPPKEKWFTTLRTYPQLWTKFVPVEFHVDYWNYLGWRDPFSNAEFTSRQKRYASEWHNQNIYTPGLVLNGKEWRPIETNEEFSMSTTDQPGLLEVMQITEQEFEVKFYPTEKHTRWQIYGALLAGGMRNRIQSGENEGKQLDHDFVVVDFETAPAKSKGLSFTTKIKLEAPKDIDVKRWSAAFWVSKEGSQRPIQAAGGDLIEKYERPSQEKIKTMLTREEFRITQHEGTELPFSNKYWDNHEDGIYVDVVTGEPLFSSKDKFDSGTGWPSFTKPIDDANVKKRAEHRPLLGTRTEVRSKTGDSHLGHVFNDGPSTQGGMRYCINSAALRFVPAAKLKENGYEEYTILFEKTK